MEELGGAELLRDACACLCHLCAGSRAARAEVAALGGIEQLVTCLKAAAAYRASINDWNSMPASPLTPTNRWGRFLAARSPPPAIKQPSPTKIPGMLSINPLPTPLRWPAQLETANHQPSSCACYNLIVVSPRAGVLGHSYFYTPRNTVSDNAPFAPYWWPVAVEECAVLAALFSVCNNETNQRRGGNAGAIEATVTALQGGQCSVAVARDALASVHAKPHAHVSRARRLRFGWQPRSHPRIASAFSCSSSTLRSVCKQPRRCCSCPPSPLPPTHARIHACARALTYTHAPAAAQELLHSLLLAWPSQSHPASKPAPLQASKPARTSSSADAECGPSPSYANRYRAASAGVAQAALQAMEAHGSDSEVRRAFPPAHFGARLQLSWHSWRSRAWRAPLVPLVPLVPLRPGRRPYRPCRRE